MDSSWCSILSFLKTTGSNSSFKVWNDGVVLLNEFHVEQTPNLFIGSDSWWVENAKKSIWFSYFVDLQTQNSKKLLAWILPKNSFVIILSKFDFLLKLIWCMYDQSSFCPIDGKYRSATAPLVAKFLVIFLIYKINPTSVINKKPYRL